MKGGWLYGPVPHHWLTGLHPLNPYLIYQHDKDGLFYLQSNPLSWHAPLDLTWLK